MNSNAVEFLKTRKLWAPVAALIMSILFQVAPDIFTAMEYTQDIENFITIMLMSMAGLIVAGDIGYDRIQASAEIAPPAPPSA